ncbi:MAG: beta-ribofuranosylaminobenzene 5'-phosphate synthase, partial [Candidatus Helarchaeota archaeon]
MKISTPSRLHFGLIDLNGKFGRIDGGIGVSLNYPNVVLEVEKYNSNKKFLINGIHDHYCENPNL